MKPQPIKPLMRTGAVMVLLGAAPLALAQYSYYAPPPQPWYLGVGAGHGHIKRSGADLTGLTGAELDNTDTTYTVRGGYRFLPYAAVEAGYYHLGRYDFTGFVPGAGQGVNGSAKAESIGLSLVGIWPISNFDLYGRIGVAHSKISFNANGPINTSNINDRQTEATYGAGVRWTFYPNWALFAEWMKNDRIRVDNYLGGIDFRF
jgi:OOP family OmpA-OmpF porin